MHDGLQGGQEGGRRGLRSSIALAKGQKPNAPAQTANGSTQTPSVLLTPVAVTKSNIKDTVIADGFLTKDQICVGAFAKDCTAAGL